MPEYEDVYEPPMLDGTGQDVAAAIRELKGVVQPTNVCIDLDVSLEVSGWSNSAPYVYNWMNNKVTTECAVKVNYLEGAEDTDDLYIGYEKIVGGIQFESPTKPTAAIPVRIHIVNAEADSITNIDDEMVSSDVISGASNVKQALTSLKNADASLSEQIGNIGSATTLWSGNGAVDTTYNLSESYKNFYLIIVKMQTNAANNDYMILPTNSIISSEKYKRYICSGEEAGQQTFPLAYNSVCAFSFPSNTTFKYDGCTYNNQYYKLYPTAVYGIIRK